MTTLTTCAVDFLRGTQTYYVDLTDVTFRSRLGSDGTLAIACDHEGRAVDAVLDMRVPKAYVLEALPRLAAIANWHVPVDEIRDVDAVHLQVEWQLDEAFRARFAGTRIDNDDWGALWASHAYLLEHTSYTLTDIQARA